MERALITVTGPADRLLAEGLPEVEEVLNRLGNSVLVVGGLMARIWLHVRSGAELPIRPTADLDLGIDRKGLRISGSRRVVGPLLEAAGFEPGTHGDTFRYNKKLPTGEMFVVDLLIAPGASRAQPPLLERGAPTVAAPGLAYALMRGPERIAVEFVDGASASKQILPVPQLDAAFVMKAALVGVRTKPGKIESDTVDASMLAALCLRDDESVEQLVVHKGRSDVGKALRFLESVDGPGSAAARRVEGHFLAEDGVIGRGVWAADVAARLAERVRAG